MVCCVSYTIVQRLRVPPRVLTEIRITEIFVLQKKTLIISEIQIKVCTVRISVDLRTIANLSIATETNSYLLYYNFLVHHCDLYRRDQCGLVACGGFDP